MKERQERKSTPELLIPVSPPMEQILKVQYANSLTETKKHAWGGVALN
jgi:hypothetical protein